MRHYVAIQIAGICNAAGLPIVFSSGDDAAHNSIFRTASYDLRPGQLLSISAFSESIEDGASVSTSGVTAFVLPADDRTGIGYRPIDIFSRLGAESLAADQVWATQGVTAGASTLQLSAGTAQTISPVLLHIGTEAVVPSSASIPASGAVTVTRGALGSLAMPHRASLSGFLARTIPVTTVPVEWIGRRVYVYVDNALWRVMMLADNPGITAHNVTLSAVDVVNQLSIAKKAGSAPAYSTSLATQSIGLEFDLFQSRPAVSVGFSPASALTTTPGSFGANGAFEGGTSTARQRLLYLFGWYQKSGGWNYRFGSSGLPGLTLTVETYPSGGDNGSTYDLQMSGGAGSAALSPSTTCYLGPATPGANLDAFLDEASARNFYLVRAIFDAATYWAGLDSPTFPGQSSDWPAMAKWYESSGAESLVSAKFTADGRLSMVSRASMQVGYVDWSLFTSPHVVGVIYRRNLAGDEAPAEVATGDDLLAGLYSRWASSGIANGSIDGPVHLDPGDEPDFYHCFYPVRPRTDGDVHNVVVSSRGVVFALDGYGWPRDRASASLDVDYCEPGLWWEPGIYTIKTTAEIPLAGSSGEVEIRWQEPSDEWLRAVAEVTFVETSGGVSTYQIGQNVEMLDGSPCVGFGCWHGFEPCQITPPTFIRRSSLGAILAQVIASTDSTSGRLGDGLGDGFAVALSRRGYLSLLATVPAGLPASYRFAADEDCGYNDLLDIACRLSGRSIVARLDPDMPAESAYGPHAVPMGRPASNEVVATWTDDDIIGIPSTADGYAGPVFSSYNITVGERTWRANDWLAADLLGQGDEMSLDLTPIVARPRQFTDDMVATLIDRLRDRFGVIRRRWSLRVPIDIGINRHVGDVVAVTSAYLIDPAGGLGVTSRLARILSISHDFSGGACDVELIAWAEYGAGWSASYDVYIQSVSSSTYTLQLLGATTPTTVVDMRRDEDLTRYAPSIGAGKTCYLVQTEGVAAGGMRQGYFTSFDAANRVATFYASQQTNNPTTTTGYRAVVVPAVPGLPAGQLDLFRVGRDRLL